MYRVVVGLALVVVVLTAGCRKKTPPQPVDVAGKAEKADGKPLAQVLLRFHPQDPGSDQAAPTCATGADGAFTVRAVPGTYKVTVTGIPLNTGGPGPGGIAAPSTGALSGVPPAYQSSKDTPWEVVVPEGGKSDVALKLK
jgi:hypothetical protein